MADQASPLIKPTVRQKTSRVSRGVVAPWTSQWADQDVRGCGTHVVELLSNADASLAASARRRFASNASSWRSRRSNAYNWERVRWAASRSLLSRVRQ